jgi:hypothetical protein
VLPVATLAGQELGSHQAGSLQGMAPNSLFGYPREYTHRYRQRNATCMHLF